MSNVALEALAATLRPCDREGCDGERRDVIFAEGLASYWRPFLQTVEAWHRQRPGARWGGVLDEAMSPWHEALFLWCALRRNSHALREARDELKARLRHAPKDDPALRSRLELALTRRPVGTSRNATAASFKRVLVACVEERTAAMNWRLAFDGVSARFLAPRKGHYLCALAALGVPLSESPEFELRNLRANCLAPVRRGLEPDPDVPGAYRLSPLAVPRPRRAAKG